MDEEVVDLGRVISSNVQLKVPDLMTWPPAETITFTMKPAGNLRAPIKLQRSIMANQLNDHFINKGPIKAQRMAIALNPSKSKYPYLTDTEQVNEIPIGSSVVIRPHTIHPTSRSRCSRTTTMS